MIINNAQNDLHKCGRWRCQTNGKQSGARQFAKEISQWNTDAECAQNGFCHDKGGFATTIEKAGIGEHNGNKNAIYGIGTQI